MALTHSTMGRLLRGACFVAAVALVCGFAPEAWACPTCKEDLATNPQARGLASGFYYSILFMMSMPFVIAGMLGTVFYRSVRNAQIEQQAAAADGELQ